MPRDAMHIVLDCRAVHRTMGGIGRAAYNLARCLGHRRRGHRVTAIVGNQLPEGISWHGLNVVAVKAAMIDEPFEQFHLPGVVDLLKADIYLNTTFSIPAVKTSKHQVAIIHDVVFEENPEWVEPRLCNYLRRWSRFSAARADHVITVSDHAKSRIESVYGIAPARVTRIYNGIDRTQFERPDENAIASVLARHRLEPPYVFYLGTLEPKKGTLELVSAFARLVRSGFRGRLALAGGLGAGHLDLQAMIAASGVADRVALLGYIDESDKKALLVGSALFVYPSHYEGFGLPPLEAMALGVPTLVSNATSLPEVVGEAALTFDVRNVEAFSGALSQGLTDKSFRHRAVAEGPIRARRFTWDEAADQLLELCERLEAA